MPNTHERFATPEPIRLHLRNAAGSVEIVAGAGPETTVDVTSGRGRPGRAGRALR